MIGSHLVVFKITVSECDSQLATVSRQQQTMAHVLLFGVSEDV